MVLNLAYKFATKEDVMTLTVTGLGIETSTVTSCLTNNEDDINMAMHDVLIEWNNFHRNKKTAYKKLCKALDDVNMSALINEALDGNFEEGNVQLLIHNYFTILYSIFIIK